jgi:mannose-6-phosphate isomerase-like protein (cupin superfamily)
MIELYRHLDEGYNPYLITPKWQIAQLNFSGDQALENIIRLDIHHETDEAFYLMHGKAVLIGAKIVESEVKFDCKLMNQDVLYNIPRNVWHNIVMYPGSKVLIIENSNTHKGDFEFYYLSGNQIDDLVKKVSQLFSEKG